MKNVILILSALLFLTACPKEEEVKQIVENISERRAEAILAIDSRNYSLEGLLKAQEYFFDFSEKVHLMIVDVEAAKNIKKFISKKGIKNFCSTFIVPEIKWTQLEAYCTDGPFYKCSPEIKEYGNTLVRFKQLAGSEIAEAMSLEPTCNN